MKGKRHTTEEKIWTCMTVIAALRGLFAFVFRSFRLRRCLKLTEPD